MPDPNDPTKDIDALLGYLSLAADHSFTTIPSNIAADYYAALTALVAERDGLLRRNAAFVACDGQWAKAFTAVEADRNALVAERNALQEENNALRSRCKAHQDEEADRVWEMVELRERVAELEAQPPAASNLRERLVRAIWPELLRIHTEYAKSPAVRGDPREQARRFALIEADEMIAAMRKEEADA